MRINKRVLSEVLVFFMMLSLHLNFILFTGLRLADSPMIQVFVRLLALIFGVGAIVLGSGRIVYVLISAVLGSVLLLLNSNYLVLNLIFMAVFVVAMGAVSMAGVSKAVLACSFLGAAIHLYFYLMGGVSSDELQVGDRVRMVMGFSNPNLLGLNYFSFLASALFFSFFNRGFFANVVLILALLVCVPIIYVSDSRTFLISAVVFIALSFLLKFRVGLVASRLFTVAMPLVGFIVSLFIAYSSELWLDELFSSRPSFFYQYLSRVDDVGFFFGWPLLESDTVDNAYLLMVGAVGFPLSFMFFAWLSLRIYAVPFFRLPLVFVMLVVSVFESALIRPEVPVVLLFVAAVFLKEKVSSKKASVNVA